jgi:hypothetical protein
MSWDIDLCADVDGNHVHIQEWNYTHNCNPMIREAGFTDWGMEALEGMSAVRLGNLLELATAAMRADPPRFEAMNPRNGWGTYATFLLRLEAIRDACREYPSAHIHASF